MLQQQSVLAMTQHPDNASVARSEDEVRTIPAVRSIWIAWKTQEQPWSRVTEDGSFFACRVEAALFKNSLSIAMVDNLTGIYFSPFHLQQKSRLAVSDIDESVGASIICRDLVITTVTNGQTKTSIQRARCASERAWPVN